MKRTIYPFAFVVLALLAGCARESMDNLSPESHSILAVIEKDSPETRTVTIDNPGVRISTYWQAGDKIGVVGKSGGPAEFSVASNDISADGKSANFRSETSVPSGSLLAFYPWQEGASASGNKLTINVPATQKYTLRSGISQPDASSSIMVASGSASIGLPFRNVMSMLKIGQAFDEPVTITKLEFRDLSGMAVCGSMTVDLDNNYSTEFSGNGTVLTLDCGKGVELKEKEMGKFFLIVPARNYPKGFEVTFITSAGEQFTRQAGVTMGKTLERGVVYPVGDVPARDYAAPDVKTEFMPGVTLISGENLDKVKVISKEMMEMGGGLDPIPIYEIIVQNELNPVVGEYFVLEANEDLPSGGVYTIDRVEPYGGSYKRVRIVPADNPACAYKNLEFGGAIWDDEGNPVEGGGLEIDLANYLSEIIDSEGNSVPFSISPSGQILLSDQAADQILGTKGLVRADKTITSPKYTYTLEGGGQSVSFSASIQLLMKAAARITDGELTFLHFTVNPILTLSLDFALSRDWDKSGQLPPVTLRFVPGVPIAPGLVMEPRLQLQLGLGVFANLKLSASIMYDYDFGQYGFSYLSGQGFSFRHQTLPPGPANFNPDISMKAEASLGVYSTLTAYPSLHIWGLMGAGIESEFKLAFALEGKMGGRPHDYFTGTMPYYGEDETLKFTLTPSLKFTPKTVSLGGWLNKKWDQYSLSVDFDPLWEADLIPHGGGGLELIYEQNILSYVYSQMTSPTTGTGVGNRYPDLIVPPDKDIMTDVKGIAWAAKYETENLLLDWDVYLYIYTGSSIDDYVSETELMRNYHQQIFAYDHGQPIKAYPPGLSLRVLNNPSLVKRVRLCTLEAGSKTETKRGFYDLNPLPYVPYGYAFALVQGEEEKIYYRNSYGSSIYDFANLTRYDGFRNITSTPSIGELDNYGYYAFCLWWPLSPLGGSWLRPYHWDTQGTHLDDWGPGNPMPW